MESQHQRHLFATYLALLQLAEEIRTLATRGMTPGGAARRMQPLPADEWAAIERDLGALLAEVRSAVERHAAPMLAGHERTAAATATRRWVAVLLGRAADLTIEFEPDHIMRRFGDMDAAEADDLRALAGHLKSGVNALLARCQGEP
jgi:hypothetical protein